MCNNDARINPDLLGHMKRRIQNYVTEIVSGPKRGQNPYFNAMFYHDNENGSWEVAQGDLRIIVNDTQMTELKSLCLSKE